MNKFLWKVVLLFSIVISTIVGLYTAMPKYSEIDTGTLPYKIKLLDSVPSPRLIFVGGSNLAYGLDSKRISDSLNINVVNTGINAGLGLRYQLGIVERRLKQNDIVVVMPEVSNFYGNIDGNDAGTLATGLICTSMDDFDMLNIKQIKNVVSDFPLALAKCFELRHNPDSTHNPKGFNEYGDNQWHWQDTTKFVIDNTPSNKTKLDREAIKWLSEKTLLLRDQGYNIILFPATLVNCAYLLNKDRIHKYYEAMEGVGVPFMVPEDAHVMPDEFVYDTPNHLNKAGVDSLTTLLIKELQELGIGSRE